MMTKIGISKQRPNWSRMNWALPKSKKEPVSLNWHPIGAKSPNLVTLNTVAAVRYSIVFPNEPTHLHRTHLGIEDAKIRVIRKVK